MEVQGDRPQDPGEDDAVEAQPRDGLRHAHGVAEDMVVEGVAAEGEEDQVPPPGIGRRLRLEDNRDQEPDVLDPSSLVLKLGHERVGRVVPDDHGVRHAGTGRSRGRGPNVGRGR